MMMMGTGIKPLFRVSQPPSQWPLINQAGRLTWRNAPSGNSYVTSIGWWWLCRCVNVQLTTNGHHQRAATKDDHRSNERSSRTIQHIMWSCSSEIFTANQQRACCVCICTPSLDQCRSCEFYTRGAKLININKREKKSVEMAKHHIKHIRTNNKYIYRELIFEHLHLTRLTKTHVLIT